MFKLVTFDCGKKCEFEFETLDEALSAALHAFDLNHELHAIEKDGICLFLHCELYQKIGRVVY